MTILLICLVLQILQLKTDNMKNQIIILCSITILDNNNSKCKTLLPNKNNSNQISLLSNTNLCHKPKLLINKSNLILELVRIQSQLHRIHSLNLILTQITQGINLSVSSSMRVNLWYLISTLTSRILSLATKAMSLGSKALEVSEKIQCSSRIKSTKATTELHQRGEIHSICSHEWDVMLRIISY